MQVPQLVLALFCVVLGVLPAIAFQWMQRALDASPQGFGAVLAGAKPVSAELWGGVAKTAANALVAPVAVVLLLGGTLLVARTISKLGNAPRRASQPWLCGYARQAEVHRYVAHHFYGEVKRRFTWLGGGPRAGAKHGPGVKDS
jgi:hypothetical protein